MRAALRLRPAAHSLLRPTSSTQILRPRFGYVHRRTFLAQVIGVIANPFETLRQLDDSRKLLEQTRQVSIFHRHELKLGNAGGL